MSNPTISDECRAFFVAIKLNPETASPAQTTEMTRAFFGGQLCAMAFCTEHLPTLSDNDALLAIRERMDELSAYALQFSKRS